MAKTYHWTCPFCDRDTTIRHGDFHADSTRLEIENADGCRLLKSLFIICPNPECNKQTLSVSLFESEWHDNLGKWVEKELIKKWELIPPSKAKSFPSYIPRPILDDYNEACLILNSSPKSSATLARRCLQGILRDFWKVKPGKLSEEIEQTQDKIDPLTWEAIDSVRKVGNIGAHMQKDINLIIDLEPNEAELLIGLIETLLRDWYIAREKRKNQLKEIKDLADVKDQKKQAMEIP